MPGIFGFYPFGIGRKEWNAVRFLYYGLQALQGRGQETVSLAWYNDGIKTIKFNGILDELFKGFSAKGFIGVGAVSSYENDYIAEVDKPVKLVLAGDGKPLLHENRGIAFKLLAKKLSELIAEKDPINGALELLNIGGGYSFIALDEREDLICARDKQGIKPLEVGSMGFDIGAVASESAAFDVIGSNHASYIKPGEVVVFDKFSISKKSLNSKRRAFCSFEYIYLSRPDSIINGIPVYKVRERIGEELSKEKIKADVVIGVPETAIPFALGFSKATGIPASLGFIRTGRHTRSALKPTQFERLIGVQLKLNPIREVVEGKDIVLIDDSVVRGNTLKNTVLNLKRKGARKVHVRIGSPPIISYCPFGTEIPPKDELIARDLSEDEIAEVIGCDSFSFLSIESLVKAIGLSKSDLCMGCFTGEYPRVG